MSGEILFDSSGNAQDRGILGPLSRSLYASFSTGASSVTYLSLDLFLAAGTPTDGGAFTISLWSSAAGPLPGSSLDSIATVSDSSLTTTFASYSFTASNLDLSADTRYWLVLSPATSSSTIWAYSLTDSGTGVASEYHTTNTTAAAGNDSSALNASYDMTVTACYAAGTRIETAHGPVAIEALALGDAVITAEGEAQAIIWLGHRTIDYTRHPAPGEVWPVRIRAGAFGPALPVRDLLVSPDHALLLDGFLVPARALLNGATVVQEQTRHITYWHLELATHDCILAEGLPAETYLDTGNRNAFENAGPCPTLHPRFGRNVHTALACAPFAETGWVVNHARARLAARAEALGYVREEGAWCIAADGAVLMPRANGSVLVPPGARRVTLCSDSARPVDLATGNADTRRLGVCVAGIAIDGLALALNDPRLTGFHAPERAGAAMWRWTDGAAILPADLFQDRAVDLRVMVTATAAVWRAGMAA